MPDYRKAAENVRAALHSHKPESGKFVLEEHEDFIEIRQLTAQERYFYGTKSLKAAQEELKYRGFKTRLRTTREMPPTLVVWL